MAVPVLMPRQGQSVETCILGEWSKKKGDKVEIGDVLFSYETDKASFEEEAKEAGVLLEVFFEEGDEVAVLENVAVIGAEGESVEEFRPGGSVPSTDAPVETEKTELVVEEKATVVLAETETEDVKISPRAKKNAETKGINYKKLQGSARKAGSLTVILRLLLKLCQP